jgi:diguanylate cyclase (GGDEF)-like protein/PAS domain S-box-containing protein
VIVASLDPLHLSQFYNSVDFDRDGYVAIVGVDGIVRANGGRAPGPLGSDLSKTALFEHYPKPSAGWYYSASSLGDRILRLVTYRAVKDYPLIVAIGLSKDEIFAEVSADQRRYYFVATALTLSILVIMGLSIRGGWLRERMAAEQHRASARLEQTRKFLDTIIENVPVPIVVKEADTLRFVLVNHAYEAFIGLARDKIMGKTVFDLFPRKEAEFITAFDHEAVRFNKRLIVANVAVNTPINGPRLADTTRLVVCDENGLPEHLLVVIDDVTEKKKIEEKIAYMAHHDALTGLVNRARFNEQLDEALARVGRGEQLAVLLLDLDRFKEVNDTFGHPVGDELLKVVAERLRGCAREIDVVARLGGDEFAVIQNAIAQPGDIAVLADRICSAIAAPYDLGVQAEIGVSIGIALAPNDATSATELMRRADVALYQAKDGGRGGYRFFGAELDVLGGARRTFVADLRRA